MLNEEIKKKFEVISPAEEKDRLRLKLAEDTKTYLANRGIIKTIPIGVTSEFPDGSLPVRTQKDYKAVHASRMKSFKVLNTEEATSKRVQGAPCEIDGSRLKYKNGECVMCVSAKYHRQAKAKREAK